MNFKKNFYLFVYQNNSNYNYKKESFLIVQNKDDYKFFINRLNINSRRIKLIKGSGVNIYKFSTFKKNKKKQILFPGRLLINKGIMEFYKAAKIVNKKYKDWTFLIAGASDYKSPVLIKEQNFREILKEKYIKYLGHVDHNKMPKLLSEVSIICLLSYREGMPMVLQEAASCGLPVITSNVIGCKEVIIKNKTGFLVQVKNVNSLVKKINFINTRFSVKTKIWQ